MKIIITIVLSILLTGCYNYHELNDIFLASSIMFDYDNDEYKITIQINDNNENELLESNGKNISEAVAKANILAKKDISFYHLKSVFITSKVDLEDVLLYLLRNPRINNSFYVLYTNDNPLEDNKKTDVGNEIHDMLKKELDYTFFDLSYAVFDDKIDFFLPLIDEDLKLSGLMLYDNYKEKELLNLDDINILKILDNKNNSYINIKNDELIEFNINECNTRFSITDKVEITIDIKVNITEYNSDIKNYEIEGINELENLIDKQMEKDIMNFIDILKENDSDILGIDRYIYNKAHNLDRDYKSYDYDIKVNSKINKKGLILG